ncbi:MAG: translation initiation factor IF-3 [Candidatus Auribacterota bacterium]|nr:translation initiation factor IF-3 [Candidatus Auribacterota bacterium]
MNRDIRANKVRAIDTDGTQLGIMPLEEGLKLAREKDLDLVCVAPRSIPPVCRILDYGKYKYELSKREKANKKQQHIGKLKEVKLKARIEEHDYQVKLRKALKFLGRGDKLRVTLTFRGREMIRQDHGRQIAQRFIDDLKEVGQVEGNPRMMGRRFTIVINPLSSSSAE